MTETNGWLTIADPFTAMAFTAAGFDSVTLDMQHGLFDAAGVAAVLFALAGKPVRRLVRPPDADAAMVGKLLDLGADGLIAPMINTVAEAEALAAGCRYPPYGRRSFGPLAERGGTAGADAAPLDIFAMIETCEGLDAVEGIAAVEGVTGLYVGPNDLALALGLGPGSDRTEPVMLDSLGRIAAAAAARGKRAGLYCASSGYAARMASLGYDFLTLMSDASALTRAGGDAVKAFHEAHSPV